MATRGDTMSLSTAPPSRMSPFSDTAMVSLTAPRTTNALAKTCALIVPSTGPSIVWSSLPCNAPLMTTDFPTFTTSLPSCCPASDCGNPDALPCDGAVWPVGVDGPLPGFTASLASTWSGSPRTNSSRPAAIPWHTDPRSARAKAHGVYRLLENGCQARSAAHRVAVSGPRRAPLRGTGHDPIQWTVSLS